MNIDRKLADDWYLELGFASANPRLYLKLAKSDLGAAPRSALVEFLQREGLYGDREKLAPLWDACAAPLPIPAVIPYRHVIPVFIPEYSVGALVPFSLAQAQHWAASDAFRGSAPADSRTPLDGLIRLLTHLENAAEAVLQIRVPLRWRAALSCLIDVPVHAGAIAGQSLQVPLAAGLLRELCAAPFSRSGPARFPFGSQPVFATGVIEEDGGFGPIECLSPKLQAFLREAGSGHPAILTRSQVKELRDGADESKLLDQVDLHIADNLRELVSLPEFRDGLNRLAGAPDITEVDALIEEMYRQNARLRFGDTRKVACWLLPHAAGDFYRLRLSLNAGMPLLHDGRFQEARQYLEEAERLLSDNSSELGADDRAGAAAALASESIDLAEPELGLRILRSVMPRLRHCSASSRVRVLGARSEVLRNMGRWDAAVDSATQAVDLAKRGFTSEAGRDMNYLAHALLRRAAVRPQTRAADLQLAAAVLEEAAGRWAPRSDKYAREIHLGFCLQFEAELARLRETPFDPGNEPPWKETWRHPYLFTLLACARNRAHSLETRIAFTDRLEQVSAGWRGALFTLFHLVYRAYALQLKQADLGPAVAAIQDWCNDQTRCGSAGWEKRLGPILKAPGRDRAPWAERLCDAIPYH